MYVQREVHKTFVEDLRQFPAVAILGPRQVGKTTLAKAFMSSSLAKSLYLDLQRPSHLSQLEDAESFLLLHKDKLICIDEIQLKPELFPLLRSLIDDDPKPGRFLILGSSSPELIRQSSETLAGRIAHIYMSAFYQNEVEGDFKKLLWRGGFPKSYLASTDSQSFRWRENYIQSFIERDLRQFGLDLNPQSMRRLWLMLCHLHGQLLNYSHLGQSLDLTHPTVKRHIDILEATFMVRRLNPFLVNIKKRLIKSPKIYIRDSGLLNSLLDLDHFEKLFSHPVYGFCWEGFAIENILNSFRANIMYGFFRTRSGEEIDLVVEHRAERWGFEFKTSSNRTLSSHNKKALEWLNLEKLFLIIPEGEAYPLQGDRIWVCPLDKLKTKLPKELLKKSVS